MQSLKLVGYGSWALSGIFAIWGLSEGVAPFLGIAVSLAVSGVLFLAFDQVITLLQEIRDSLRPAEAGSEPLEVTGSAEKPVRSIDEISADLERMKANVAKT